MILVNGQCYFLIHDIDVHLGVRVTELVLEDFSDISDTIYAAYA